MVVVVVVVAVAAVVVVGLVVVVVVVVVVVCVKFASLLLTIFSDSSCDNTFVLNSQCYKVHSTESIPWFTAVNRCLSNNASLAVFDDNVRQYFPSSVLPDKAWIGLLKSWWTWPGYPEFDIRNFTVAFA